MKKDGENVKNDRSSLILGKIIEEYIRSGEPMGSKTLASLLPYTVSSATIRNEMARLGELGYLEQRHTSGGRIPSLTSYRYYVNNIMQPQKVTAREASHIYEALSVNASDPERLLADAARLCADVTGCAAFASAHSDRLDCVQGVEIIPAGSGKVMLIVLSTGGRIKSSLCRVQCAVDSAFTDAFYALCNRYFIGTPLEDVNLSLIQSTAQFLGAQIFEMLPILTALCALCREAARSALFIEGETNLLAHEELGPALAPILSFLADRESLKKQLADYAQRGSSMELFIGGENTCYALKKTVTMIASFSYGSAQRATLGVIGSTRIDYARIIPRVSFICETVGKLLKQGGVSYAQ